MDQTTATGTAADGSNHFNSSRSSLSSPNYKLFFLSSLLLPVLSTNSKDRGELNHEWQSSNQISTENNLRNKEGKNNLRNLSIIRSGILLLYYSLARYLYSEELSSTQPWYHRESGLRLFPCPRAGHLNKNLSNIVFRADKAWKLISSPWSGAWGIEWSAASVPSLNWKEVPTLN